MRVSSSLIFQTGLKTINAQQSDLLHLYQQIGTGQKMVTPSDDPLGAAQSINLSQAQSINARYGENRASAMQKLGFEEDALNSLTYLLQDIRTRLVEASNGTLSDSDRGSLSAVIEKALDESLSLANTTDGNGEYIFSGSKGDTAPYTKDGTYYGDLAQRNVQADQTRQIATSDVGSDIFQRVQPGTRAYTSQQVDQGTGSTLVMSKPMVSDTSLGNLQADNKFIVKFTTDTEYQVTITDANGDEEVNTGTFSEGQTQLNLGKGTVVNIDGIPAKDDTFEIRPMSESKANLFGILNELKDALNVPVQNDEQGKSHLINTLNTGMQKLASIYDNVLTVRSSIGARMNEIEALDNTGIQRNLGYTKALSDIEDLDWYEASMRLNLRSMALEGAGMAFKTIQGLSLFNRG